MYKCQKCGKVTDPGEKLNKVVTSTREKTYVNAILGKDGNPIKDRFGNISEKISHGSEICGEMCVCSKCLGLDNEKQDNNFTKPKYDKELYKTHVLGKFVKKENNTTERKYPNSNYQGKNFDPDFYKKKYANQSVKRDK